MNKKLLLILTIGFLAITQTADAFIARRARVSSRRWGWRYGYPGYRHGYYGHDHYHGHYHY